MSDKSLRECLAVLFVFAKVFAFVIELRLTCVPSPSIEEIWWKSFLCIQLIDQNMRYRKCLHHSRHHRRCRRRRQSNNDDAETMQTIRRRTWSTSTRLKCKSSINNISCFLNITIHISFEQSGYFYLVAESCCVRCESHQHCRLRTVNVKKLNP